MALTPIDVQQKTFGTALRGYDLDEVDDFLDDVVTALKDYEQRLRDAQERIGTLEMERTDHGDAEGAIARALVAAQRSADTIVAEAKDEAERIVEGARAEASQAETARDEERRQAEEEIRRIRSLLHDLRTRVHGLAGAVAVSLDEADSALDTAESDLESSPAHEAPEATEAATEAEEVAEVAVTSADEESTSELPSWARDPSPVEEEAGAHTDWTTPVESDDATVDDSWSVKDRSAEDSGHSSRPWEVG